MRSSSFRPNLSGHKGSPGALPNGSVYLTAEDTEDAEDKRARCVPLVLFVLVLLSDSFLSASSPSSAVNIFVRMSLGKVKPPATAGGTDLPISASSVSSAVGTSS